MAALRPGAARAQWGANRTPQGQVEIRDGKDIRANWTLDPALPPNPTATPQTRLLSVLGHPVVEVRLPLSAVPGQVVWLGEVDGTDLRPIWSGPIGARDVDGESRSEIEVSALGIVHYQTLGRITRCDDQPTRLFQRRWRFADQRWEAVERLPGDVPSPRFASRPSGFPRPVPGRAPPPGFVFAAASASPGDHDDASRLLAPSELNDGDPTTAWIIDNGRSGRGEFVTARLAGPAIPVHAVVVTRAAARARHPTRLTLILGPKPSEQIPVQLGSAAIEVVTFDRPVRSNCVTVAIDDVAGPADAPVAIGDVRVVSTLDEGASPQPWIDQVGARPACAASVPLLVSWGQAAVPPLVASLAAGTPPGRPCLLTALADLSTAEHPLAAARLQSVLRRVIPDATLDEEKSLGRLLQRTPGAAVEGLAVPLADPAVALSTRQKMLRLLLGLPDREVRERLGGLLGRVDDPLRPALRDGLAGLPATALPTLLEAWPQARDSGETARQADLVLVLAALGAQPPGPPQVLRDILDFGGQPNRPFELRARVVEAWGRLADLPALDHLLRQDADAVLRRLAVTAMPEGAAALPLLRGALSDADPAVREIAAHQLGRRHDGAASGPLLAVAKRELWPFARRAEVVALGKICGPAAGDLLVRALSRDIPEIRRAALRGLSQCHDPRTERLLVDLFARSQETPELRALAVTLLPAPLHAEVARQLVGASEELLAAPPDEALEGVLLSALPVVAAAGGEAAKRLLLQGGADSRPLVKQAAVEQLGSFCPDRAVHLLLTQAAASRDRNIANAAHRALRRCSREHSGIESSLDGTGGRRQREDAGSGSTGR